VEIVVTDLTRMRDGYICVAGIDLANGRRVRPVSGRLGRELLRPNGGPFDIRAVVDLGSCRRVGSKPEVEDVLFVPSNCVDRGDLDPDEFYHLCRSHSHDDLGPIGPKLTPLGRSLTTLEGLGECSLVLVSSAVIPRVFVNSYNRLRYIHNRDTELSVTDVRLYAPDLLSPDRRKVSQLQRLLTDCDEVVLSFGLGRPWRRPDDSRRRHYLQLNNIHLNAHPDWQLR
jgi:hypothetical protein